MIRFVMLNFTIFLIFSKILNTLIHFILHSFYGLFQLNIHIIHFQPTKHTFYSIFQIFHLFLVILKLIHEEILCMQYLYPHLDDSIT